MSHPSYYARVSAGLLPKMSKPELQGIQAWAIHKRTQGRYVVLCNWLQSLVEAELRRRESDGLEEPGMIDIPAWSTSELSDALLGVYVLSRGGLTMQQGRFVDEILMMLIVDAHVVLNEFSNHPVVTRAENVERESN